MRTPLAGAETGDPSPPATATSVPFGSIAISCADVPGPPARKARSPVFGSYQLTSGSRPAASTRPVAGCTATASTS